MGRPSLEKWAPACWGWALGGVTISPCGKRSWVSWAHPRQAHSSMPASRHWETVNSQAWNKQLFKWRSSFSDELGSPLWGIRSTAKPAKNKTPNALGWKFVISVYCSESRLVGPGFQAVPATPACHHRLWMKMPRECLRAGDKEPESQTSKRQGPSREC